MTGWLDEGFAVAKSSISRSGVLKPARVAS